MLRNRKKYRLRVIDLFKGFLDNKINHIILCFELSKIENEISEGKFSDKDLWFKFSNDDTMATTVLNIFNGLSSDVNDEFYKEKFRFAIENPKELKIYYS